MKLVVTSGPTREWIDPVRFISNPSTGRTGWEIARAGIDMFKNVTYITGAVLPPYTRVRGAHHHHVESTAEMMEAVQDSIGPDCLLIMAAAPADFTVPTRREEKIKKENTYTISLDLVAAPDILLSLKSLRLKNFIRVGFAAETNDLIAHAASKLKRKNLDFICANEVHRDKMGFGENPNTLHVMDRSETIHTIGPMPKDELARALLNFIVKNVP